jgi:hypothetical protein
MLFEIRLLRYVEPVKNAFRVVSNHVIIRDHASRNGFSESSRPAHANVSVFSIDLGVQEREHFCLVHIEAFLSFLKFIFGMFKYEAISISLQRFGRAICHSRHLTCAKTSALGGLASFETQGWARAMGLPAMARGWKSRRRDACKNGGLSV